MTNYKGYVGKVNVNTETGLIRGKVINTRDVITFHGSTVEEAKQAFRDSVDEYLAFCESLGEAPEKQKGSLQERLTWGAFLPGCNSCGTLSITSPLLLDPQGRWILILSGPPRRTFFAGASHPARASAN